MGLLDRLWGGAKRPGQSARAGHPARHTQLLLERLEDRTVLNGTAVLNAGSLVVTGYTTPYDLINVALNQPTNQIVVKENGIQLGAFDSTQVTNITVTPLGRFNVVRVDPAVLQPTTLEGNTGTNFLFAGNGESTEVGGTGTNRLVGGVNNDLLIGGQGVNTLSGLGGNNNIITGPGINYIFGAKDRDTVLSDPPQRNFDLRIATTPPDLSSTLGLKPSVQQTLTADEVATLLSRAAAASSADDGIVAVVDRGGRVLGVRVEANVSPLITGNTANLVFAIDGAIAEARTAALFANNQAPLTSRTIQFISQSTITQQMVESNPSITDVNSPLRGPGYVAPIGLGGHFPPDIFNTPQVDLFEIEGTNRDTTFHAGPSGVAGAADSVYLPQRFNANPADIPSSIPANQQLEPMDSYGFLSGLEPLAQPRGIGTLPGGIPIIKNGAVAGGIGVFFPGTTGFADEENSSLSANYDPAKLDRSLEAEYDAFAAVGGSAQAGFSVGTLGGIAPLPEISLPFGRIDLVGITLPLFGPGGIQGPENLKNFAAGIQPGNPNSGFNAPLLQPNADGRVIQENAQGQPILGPNGLPLLNTTFAANNLLPGTPVPEGFLVTPHAGDGLTADQVEQMIAQGVNQAIQTRAAIRLPIGSATAMVIAVSDKDGNILGLFRMPDATIFSLDVAVAKARNVAYYANPAQLQPIDQTPGVAPGVAFTNRTFRYLSLPRYPEGIDGNPPGPFSILNDGNVLPTGLNAGPPLPSSAFFNTVLGHDAFFPQTNFHDPNNILNQNGIVFFPGSVPVYSGGALAGGLGVSGDGVDQDDVVTFFAKQGFDTPPAVPTIDEFLVGGVRLPYQKFNRSPELPG